MTTTNEPEIKKYQGLEKMAVKYRKILYGLLALGTVLLLGGIISLFL